MVDRVVHQGVTSILTFAATVLAVPDGVIVRKVDLGQELQILAYYEQRKSEGAEIAARAIRSADVTPGGEGL